LDSLLSLDGLARFGLFSMDGLIGRSLWAVSGDCLVDLGGRSRWTVSLDGLVGLFR
jgi:hypothetical protein